MYLNFNLVQCVYCLTWLQVFYSLSTVTSAMSDQPDQVLPHCQLQNHIIFVEEPVDVTVANRTEEIAMFPCKYEGSIASPTWMINSTTYTTLNLPLDHQYRDNKLIVLNAYNKNGTEYQCSLVFFEGSGPCTLRSSIGRLIVRNRGFRVYNDPYYSFGNNSLKEIDTKISITQTNVPDSVYNIMYVESDSSMMCATPADFNASSCVNGVCSHIFNASTSSCSKNKSIKVIATELNDNSSEVATIDANNTFVNVSFSRTYNNTVKVKCTFATRPQTGENLCNVTMRPNCGNVTLSSQGSVSDAGFVTVRFDNFTHNETCFLISARNMTKRIFLRGIYNSASSENNSLRFIPLLQLSTVLICASVLYLFQ